LVVHANQRDLETGLDPGSLAPRSFVNVREPSRRPDELEGLGTMAGGIAHGFNNMLTVIQTHGELLRECFGPEHPERGNVELILQAAERAAVLTSQLLAFSRRQVQQLRITNLNEVVLQLAPVLEAALGPTSNLLLTLDPGLRPCRVDLLQMEQVLLNLAENARDAMPEGGLVEIRTETLAAPTERLVALGADPRSQYVRLCMKDCGSGMDPVTCARAFEPFFTTKDPSLKNGLGLSTVYGIIRQTGGHVWVESEPGAGTSVNLYLPCFVSDLPPESSERYQRMPLSGKQVLLVEDEPLVRRAARRVLERAGCTVLEAGDAAQALALIGDHKGEFDALVSDVLMPGMNGQELSEHLRQAYPHIAVLLMSGYTERSVNEDAVAGIAFLHKPFSPDALVRKVEQALSQAPSSAKAPSSG
jgi:two-component system cell cycle sensor histidine kinase/response regulator CckA